VAGVQASRLAAKREGAVRGPAAAAASAAAAAAARWQGVASAADVDSRAQGAFKSAATAAVQAQQPLLLRMASSRKHYRCELQSARSQQQCSNCRSATAAAAAATHCNAVATELQLCPMHGSQQHCREVLGLRQALEMHPSSSRRQLVCRGLHWQRYLCCLRRGPGNSTLCVWAWQSSCQCLVWVSGHCCFRWADGSSTGREGEHTSSCVAPCLQPATKLLFSCLSGGSLC
jgi:hypothetical protein